MTSLTPHDIGLLTLTEASEIAELPIKTIRQWIWRYKLPTTRVLGPVMVSELAFLDCETARRNSPQRRLKRK